MKALRPVFAFCGLVLLAGPVLAQGRYANVDVRAGYTLPLSDAKDTFKGQSSFGAGAAIALADRIHLGVTLDWAHHSVKQADGTVIGGPNDEQYNVFHTFLKVSFDAVNQDKFTVGLNAGPGLIFFSPNDVLKRQAVESDRRMAINAGLTITWWFSDRIGLLASPQADIALSRSSGHILTHVGSSSVYTSKAFMFPITGGFRFKI
ncbi:MAG TPA: hypothetical protein VL241_00240 [Gemmatimonadales bacterium]|jgi:hypothetical protein|nr:hypothetical protein [Gemmatimonadales bacterium]